MELTSRPDGLYTEEGNFFGDLRSSVGPHGESTGAFTECRTTSPLSELGVTHLDGQPVQEYE